MFFTLKKQAGRARVGQLRTAHGAVETPVFMPVATYGAVKSLLPVEIYATGSELVLTNAYHLHLAPGEGIVKEAGGIAKFTGIERPFLSDSGGYQVFSLGHRRSGRLAKVTSRGVHFRSHRDGSRHYFSPEKVLAIQRALGVDIMMPLDDCPPADASPAMLDAALKRTHRWLDRAVSYWQEELHSQPALFGITQGGTDLARRRQSIAAVTAHPLSGFALGGLAVGESSARLHAAIAAAAPLLPPDRPRYLMGVGQPCDLLWAIKWGIDMFDCVLPTRLARHGSVWILTGPQKALRAFWREETEKLLGSESSLNIVRHTLPRREQVDNFNPMQPGGEQTPLCQLTWASAQHFRRMGEPGLVRQLSLHNLLLVQIMLRHAKKCILTGQYDRFLTLFGVQ